MFAFLAHPEHLPRYGAPLWLSGDLEDRRGGDARASRGLVPPERGDAHASRGPVPAGGEPLIALRGYFAGLPVEAVVRTTTRAPYTLEITQVRGTLRGFSQRFKIETDEEGTLLTCLVEADPGIPMLSDEAAKHFLIQYVERMLDRLRLAAERRAPSRRPRPAAKNAAADAEAADAAADEAAAAAEGPVEAAAPGATNSEGGVSESAPSAETAETAGTQPQKRPQRQFPQRRPRPARSGAPHPPRAPQRGPDAAPDQAAAADAAPAGQGRRRRRRRRRRGRGTTGPGPDGGPPAQGPQS